MFDMINNINKMENDLIQLKKDIILTKIDVINEGNGGYEQFREILLDLECSGFICVMCSEFETLKEKCFTSMENINKLYDIYYDSGYDLCELYYIGIGNNLKVVTEENIYNEFCNIFKKTHFALCTLNEIDNLINVYYNDVKDIELEN